MSTPVTARGVGLFLGLGAFVATVVLPPPAGMTGDAWLVAGMILLMATWWITEAVPLTATALLPFLILPMGGVLNATETAAAYYSPTLFLILGGAFIALAIERTGLHRRLARFILDRIGSHGGPFRLLFGFMLATGILSTFISNTSAALIMMPMALAVLAGGGVSANDQDGLAGALPIGIAFAASIGGLGMIVGSPTNAIAVGLLDTALGVRIGFAQWAMYGMPVVLLGIPLAAFIIARVQRIDLHPFDAVAARVSLGQATGWTEPERRLVPLVVLTFVLWVASPLIAPLLPKDSLTDGTIAIAAGVALFLIPDGTGRPLLTWEEADRAPWGVIMMFGGGLALAAGMSASGLAGWLGQSLLPLAAVPTWLVALAIVALVIVITEFASNVATASGIMPVVAGLIAALGTDPMLLAIPAAFAASWGFMLPAGTGPNAIAWATGHIRLSGMVKSGLVLDVAGAFLIVGVVWLVAALT